MIRVAAVGMLRWRAFGVIEPRRHVLCSSGNREKAGGGAVRSQTQISGVRVMKQICYLFWIAGMATLVAYGWSDNIFNQVSEAFRFMGQLVAFMMV